MRISLNPGVSLSLISTKQFKTTRIAVDLITPLKSESLIKRLLLASVLENSSQKYPSQKILSEELARMYGAGFGVSTERKGNIHALSFNLECVNEHFLNTNSQLLEQGISFLKEIIFKPLLDGNRFDPKTFERQKEVLADYISSVKDDRQLFATLELNNAFFEDDGQALPSFGDAESLAKITNEELYKYYIECINNDQVEIIISGDVADEKSRKIAASLNFSDRYPEKVPLFYVQPLQNQVKERVHHLEISQAKLNLGYSLPVYFQENKYYAALVFNDLFGGQPLSKLFVNVREKASLAYYASSSYDSFRGFLSVKTGIEAKNKNQVLQIVNQQLEELRAGNSTKKEIETAKRSLINSYLSQLDHQGVLLSRALFNGLLNKELQENEWIEKIKSVTIADIAEIAGKAHLEAVSFLDGKVKNENN
ncbi:EF-P 5-aminopentanol modification-associated protein YfmF [Liquorilactobacillus mali]|uniref:EF-P 5-aminopentanol modification-associated protein YfmF n=1 Tax=Liquorilactobacillus mali TaxID=1618 RepID=UPI002954B82E|nr:pitrilysin family protein [Liquorilactobacillus mali]MDV7756763.1 insulinase family protein [Liquorilactobacillus mali]